MPAEDGVETDSEREGVQGEAAEATGCVAGGASEDAKERGAGITKITGGEAALPTKTPLKSKEGLNGAPMALKNSSIIEIAR